MVKAEQKKAQNISEYIIYMYQSEDLVRTFEFDLNQINEYVITHIPITATNKKELILWYASLIEKMELEKIKISGHLKELNILIDELTELHNKLIKESKDYQRVLQKATPHIKKQIRKSGHLLTNPVQISINAIYGFLLLKLNGKKVSNQQQKMLECFGSMLSFLSYKYKNNQN